MLRLRFRRRGGSWFRWMVEVVYSFLFRFPRSRLTLGALPPGFYQNALPFRLLLSLLTDGFQFRLFLAPPPVDLLTAGVGAEFRNRKCVAELPLAREICTPTSVGFSFPQAVTLL